MSAGLATKPCGRKCVVDILICAKVNRIWKHYQIELMNSTINYKSNSCSSIGRRIGVRKQYGKKKHSMGICLHTMFQTTESLAMLFKRVKLWGGVSI